MKKIGKKSIIIGLKFSIDLTLILLAIGVIVGIATAVFIFKEPPTNIDANYDLNGATMESSINNITIEFQNSNYGENSKSIKTKFQMLFLLLGFTNVIALIFMTLQLRYIFKSFNKEDYFSPLNSIRVKNIALVIFLWVIADYAIRLIPEFTILHYYVASSTGFNSVCHGFLNALLGINLKMLIVSIIIYVLSIAFKYGTCLKEESSLTI